MIATLATKLIGFLCLCVVLHVVVVVRRTKEIPRVCVLPGRHRSLRFLGNLNVFRDAGLASVRAV